VSGYAATVIMVGLAMSAANKIPAADTDTHTTAAASPSRQHSSIQVFSASLTRS